MAETTTAPILEQLPSGPRLIARLRALTPARLRRVLATLRTALSSLLSPPAFSILVSLPLALVPVLKALFVAPPAPERSPIPNAPDGQPPLAFVLDTATFVGAASVPLGLICLGSAIARLQIPHHWSKLPVGSILSLAILKMVVTPVLGVLIVEGLTNVGFIDKGDKVLRFVCM